MDAAAKPPVQLATPRVLRAFGLLVTIPLGLVALELLGADRLPEIVLSALAFPYALFVYLPVALVGAFVIEPLGLPALLAPIPFATELLLLATLAGVYYLVTVTAVNLHSLASRAVAE